jgi:beta-glucanase (GH16 family)
MEIGGSGWGNNELQYYTNNTTNAMVNNGLLTITALKESYGGRQYTSARITTQNKFTFKYGRVEARIKLPYGQGIWPAFWMLGANFSSVGWPTCGEVDIMEMVGGTGKDNRVYSTLHWDNGGHQEYGSSYSLSPGIFADDFHVFSIEWDENKIRSYVDGNPFFVIDITPAFLSEFHQNFFLIMNVAVGGNWPGSPNASTVFPQTMQVDYVRVYQGSK